MAIPVGIFLAIVSAMFFALGNVLARRGTDHLHRDAGFLLSTTSNAVTLVTLTAGTLAVRGAAQASLPAVAFFAAGGIFGTFCGRWVSLRAIERLGPSRASTYKNAQPLFTTAIAVPLLGEPLTWGSFLGGALIMVGIWFLTTEPLQRIRTRGWDISPETRRGGVALGLASAVAYGTGNILRKLGIGLWPDPVIGAGVAIFFTMIPTLLTPAIWRQRAALRQPWRRGHWCFIGWGLCTSAAQVAFFAAVKHSPVWIVNVVMAVEPLLTIFVSFGLFRGRERIGRWVLFSALLVVAGLAILASRPGLAGR